MLAESFWSSMFQFPQIAVVMGCLTGMTVIVGICWSQVEKTKSKNELKRSMVERGLSAEEIERIMDVGEAERQP